MTPLLNGAVLVLAAALGLLLGWSMLDLPVAAVRLPEAVQAQLEASGVAHPVTAVLLNFRGYDTLLEIAVLLVALLGMLVLSRHSSGEKGRSAPASLTLHAPLRLLVPVMVLVAGYLLWAGAHRPGGAFQAAAVLAGTVVLLHLAELLSFRRRPRRALRAGLAAGLLFFVAVAAAVMVQGRLLQYPPDSAGALILAIEAGLTVSLGLILAGLYLLLTDARAGT